jgi:DnaJ-class molecular chaperone
MDHYTTLGVARNATPDEIKKAYRKMASQYHPDKGGDTAKFQKIEEAYRILIDPNSRQQYDNPMPHGMPGGFGFPGGSFHFQTGGININDFFGQFFGQPPHQQRTQVMRTHLMVSLQDAYNGVSHVIQLQTPTGPVVASLDIPKGIRDGMQIKYDNIIGDVGLLVDFRIMPDLKFERQNDDLYSNYPISILDLIVGNSFKFITISGKELEVVVKPKTQPNTQLKLPGHGMPMYGTSVYGDQIILIKPFMPDNIDKTIIDSILQAKTQ